MGAGALFLKTFADVFPTASAGGGTFVMDDARLEELTERLERLADPQLECMMVGSEGMATVSYTGPAGFRKAWTDWLEGFERVRFKFEDILEADRTVVVLARQIGTTRYGVELEQPSAMVCTVSADGKLTRLEFHLDREVAMRAAGLDPRAARRS